MKKYIIGSEGGRVESAKGAGALLVLVVNNVILHLFINYLGDNCYKVTNNVMV